MTESVAEEAFLEGYWRDPHGAFDRVRDSSPVRRVDFEHGSTWLVTRYADVRAGLVDERLAKDRRACLPTAQRAAAEPALPGPMSRMLSSVDPPDHTRLRRLVTKEFTARRIAALRPKVEAIARDLLDGLPEDEPVDLVARFAVPLPMEMICELLGVPELEREEFARWSATLIDECPAPELVRTTNLMADHLEGLIAAKRSRPDAALLSALITAADEGDRLSDDEIVAMAMALLIAGHETSAVFLTNSVRVLLDDDAARAMLSTPASVPALVEELLRWISPALNTSERFATEDMEIAGVRIARGESVTLSTGGANRDPARFAAPQVLDPSRDTTGHRAFGHGIHRCLGAALVRLEGEIALTALFNRFPRMRAAVDPAELVFRRSVHVHCPHSFPVILGPRAAR